MKRRILHKFVLNDISAVDRPCQEDARMVIMKRKQESEMDGELYLQLEDQVYNLEKRIDGFANRQSASFEQRVDEIRKRDNCPRVQAMQRARAEFPNAFDHFASSPIQKSNSDFDALVAQEIRKGSPVSIAGQRVISKYGVQPNSTAIQKAKAAGARFEEIVTSIMADENVPRSSAMAKARREHPTEYEAYQEG